MPSNKASITIDADVTRAAKAMKQLTSSVQQMSRSVNRNLDVAFGKNALKLSDALLAKMKYAAAGLGVAGAAAVKMSSDFQVASKSMEVLTGSAAAAQKHLSDLEKFAASTPFEFNGIVDASRRLQAFGFRAEEVIGILETVGDASMALGKGQEGIDAITRALGQIQAKGKLSAEEMTSQLSETGLPAWQILAEEMGKSVAEVQDMTTKGLISSQAAIEALLSGMKKRYGGMMKEMANEIPQQLSNAKDSVAVIMREIGDSITEELDLKERLASATSWLGDFAQEVKESGFREAIGELVPDSAKAGVIALGSALTGVLVPALLKTATTAAGTYAAFAPIAGGAAALGLAFSELSGTTNLVDDDMKALVTTGLTIAGVIPIASKAASAWKSVSSEVKNGYLMIGEATTVVSKMSRAFVLAEVQVRAAGGAMNFAKAAALGLGASMKALMASIGPAGWAALIAGGTAWLVLKERMEDAAKQAEITQKAIASVNHEFASANAAQLERALKDAGKELAALEERALSAKLSLMELWNAKETYDGGGLLIPEIGVALPQDTLAKASGQNFNTEEYEAKRTELQTRIEKLKELLMERQKLEESVNKGVSSPKGGTPSTPASGGKSAAEKLVENIRDQMKYLGKDGNEFLAVLDRWQAKLPTLSKDWKAVTDLKFDILGENAERSAENAGRVLERIEKQKEAAKELAEVYERADREYLSGLGWENSQGLMSNTEYLDILSKKIEELGLKTKDVFNWTDNEKAWFAAYQNIGSEEFSNSLDLIKKRYESGSVSAAQYKATLEQLKQQYADMPLVVKMANEELAALNDTMNKYPTAAQQASAAWDSAKESLYNVPSGIGSAFESAIRGTESLSDAMLGLLQDIGAVIVKALIMRAL
ncbi:tape measure protein, partial [Cloacibacillus sp. An23]|uniref:tape measure protein n=1 Tax=Cloacibacillus sp. An23 TaxID=1965591 RepID=UPI000B567087